MELSRLVFIGQLTLGAFITCLSVYTFINIKYYITLSVETQLNMMWYIVALSLLVYGLLQLSQGLVEMLEEMKERDENALKKKI